MVYFNLESDRRPLLTQMLGAAIVQDLQTTVAALQGRPTPTLVVIDEFSALAAAHVVRLFGRARSAGFSLLLCTQELSDLRLPGRERLLEQVMGNLSVLIAHRQVVPESAELIASVAGRRGAWRTSRHSDGASTRTRIREGVLDSTGIVSLDTGWAAVIVLAGGVRVRFARILSRRCAALRQRVPRVPQTTKGGPMVQARHTPSPEREAIIGWTARMGAITAEALAYRQACRSPRHAGACSPQSARDFYLAATRCGERRRCTRSRGPACTAAACSGLDPCRVTASNALHAIVCADVAAALERCYPDHQVLGERELRRDERERGRSLASAHLGSAGSGGPRLHRPDLVLWPKRPEEGLPVAVEVELTIKAPRRLLGICLAWARCRSVAGVLYLVVTQGRACGRTGDRGGGRERADRPGSTRCAAGARSTAIVQAERTVPGDA